MKNENTMKDHNLFHDFHFISVNVPDNIGGGSASVPVGDKIEKRML